MKYIKWTLYLVVILFFSLGLQAQVKNVFIDNNTIDTVKDALVKEFGAANGTRIDRGVTQAAQAWTEEDGTKEEFLEFCKSNFIGDPQKLELLFKRFEMYSEMIAGYNNEMYMDIKQPVELNWGEILPIDERMSEYSPISHLMDDFYKNKISFIILLNFPAYTLEEKIKSGDKWSRKDWAQARIGDTFDSRQPASVEQEIARVTARAELYISRYNIYVGKLIDQKGLTYFPEDKVLLSHWNLRDEIKSNYKEKDGFAKQKMIYKVMERIISQEIPGDVVDNPKYKWNPFTNTVYDNGKVISAEREPDTRYARFLDMYKAEKASDPYYPAYPTHIKRIFEQDREIPEAEIEALFTGLLSSPEVGQVASLIEKRLHRKLQPFDIWYDGFKADSGISEQELDKITKAKYPTGEAFEKDIVEILVKLGFSKEKAAFISSQIRVDAARGSGHCASSLMKSAKTRLRTRVTKDGMDYKGYNIAVHELGHAVESTISLHDVDYYSLIGVPNIAFTEAFAFLFQARDLDLLGVKKENPQEKYLQALDIFWNSVEIMGVSLVDMKVWNWLYQNPDATPAQLKEAVISIAKEVWNKYYAPVFKVKDQTVLAIYSHMIDSALYLPDYPLGYVIQSQIEKYMDGKNVGTEMERMCKSGKILPQLWMENAVGSKISVKPMLDAVKEALPHVK